MEKKIDIPACVEYVGSKLYKFDAAPMAYAWNTGENVLLYGPGGYGKSDGAIFFHDFLIEQGAISKESKPFVQFMGPGMSEERLLGGVDLKSYENDGQIIYNLQYAFTNHEVVVLEEIWDAYPNVLLVLKDILSSGQVRNGAQVADVRTKIIIACTNRSRDEVITDHSMEALFQRFAFEHEVKWESHKREDYIGAMRCAMRVEEPTQTMYDVADICSVANEELDIPISPRTAMKALKVSMKTDMMGLQFFFGLEKAVDRFIQQIKERQKKVDDAKLFLERIRGSLIPSEQKLGSGSMNIQDLLFALKERYLEYVQVISFEEPDNTEIMERFVIAVRRYSIHILSIYNKLADLCSFGSVVINPGNSSDPLSMLFTDADMELDISSVQLTEPSIILQGLSDRISSAINLVKAPKFGTSGTKPVKPKS